MVLVLGILAVLLMALAAFGVAVREISLGWLGLAIFAALVLFA